MAHLKRRGVKFLRNVAKEASAGKLPKRTDRFTVASVGLIWARQKPSKQHALYRALKTFGRIVKSIFILRYIDDLELRQVIEKQLNKIENSHQFSRAVSIGNPREFTQAEKQERLNSNKGTKRDRPFRLSQGSDQIGVKISFKDRHQCRNGSSNPLCRYVSPAPPLYNENERHYVTHSVD